MKKQVSSRTLTDIMSDKDLHAPKATMSGRRTSSFRNLTAEERSIREKKRALTEQEWTWRDTKRYVIVSVIVVMVILHPTLTRQSLFLFMCTDIEGQAYLRKDVQIPCYDTQHLYFCLFVGAPGVIVYVAGTPALTYFVLYRRRHKLTVSGPAGQETRSTYGFLYRGYRLFYWEIVIMTRKVSMVIVAVFGLRATVQTQALMALLVVVLAGAAHIAKSPFSIPILNKLELYGLVTAFVTLYFGMFFFTKDVVVSPTFQFFVTSVILLTNFCYVTYWSLSVWKALVEEINFLKKIHTCLFVKCSGLGCCPKLGRRPPYRGRDGSHRILTRKTSSRRTVWDSMKTEEEKKIEKKRRSRWNLGLARPASFKKSGVKEKRALEMVELGSDPREYMRRKKILDENIRLASIAAESHLAKGMLMRSSSAKDLLEMTRKKRVQARRRFGGAISAVKAQNHMLKMIQVKRKSEAETKGERGDAIWSRKYDDKAGKHYFVNKDTEEIVWASGSYVEESGVEEGSQVIRKNPLHHRSSTAQGNNRRLSKHVDAVSGKVYWHDKDTGQSRWED